MVVISFGHPRLAQAEKPLDLKTEYIGRHRQSKALPKKIESIKAAGLTQMDMLKEINERLIVLEKKGNKPCKGGFSTFRGAKCKLAGKLLFEFIDTQNHAQVDEPKPHFLFRSFNFCPKISLHNDISMKGKIKFQRDKLLVKKFFVNFDNLPFHSFFRAGLNSRFMRPQRKTKRYPLAGNAFWRKNETGISAGGEFDFIYHSFSNSSISRIRAGKLGWVKLISGAGSR